jgi:hypothetical protein
MGNVNIYLRKVNGLLELRDDSGNNPNDIPVNPNVTTWIGKNDHVFWKKDDPGSGINSIDNVLKYPDSQDLFSSDPRPTGQGWWTGVIGPNANGTESYSITVDGVPHDPKLQIH